ncbi:MAG TPA: hypothetical protein DEA63_03880 [Firmicutes bacterium]|nr:hypothetical protein [Bacillota bacterium]
MKKTSLFLLSAALLASCGSSSPKEEDGKAYIASLKEAAQSSLRQESRYFKSAGVGGKIAFGVKNQNGTYYHLTGSSLSFEAGAKNLKSTSVDELQGMILLQGGEMSLDTNQKDLSEMKGLLKLSPLKAKAYLNQGAVYFNASGEKNADGEVDTNATLGLLVQTLIRSVDSDYVLYGGGNRLEGKNKYKGKWTLGEEEKGNLQKSLPLVKEDADLSSLDFLSSFLEGAYQDESGKTAFSFQTKEDKSKKISFSSKDKNVLSCAFASAISSSDYSSFTSETSAPSYQQAKEKADEFFLYAEPKAFTVEAYFSDKSLLQVRVDINFALDEAKIAELYPNGMFDFSSEAGEGSDPKETQFSLDGTLAISGNVLCDFTDPNAISLPDLSSYLEFPEIVADQAQ